MKPTRWLLVIIVIFTLLLSACSPASSSQSESGMNIDKGGPVVDGEMGRAPMEEAPAAPAQPSGRSGAPGQASAVERLVIKNASLTVIVPKVLDSQRAITAMAERMGGFVVSSNVYMTTLSSGEEIPQASITIRVPADQLDEALDEIKRQVERPGEDVLNETVSGQDVTKEYTDLQSRLRNLEDAEQQLRQIMEDATRAEDVLNIFNQLTYVREQIEVIKGQMQYYEESAQLSSISVEVRAQETVEPLTIGRWQPAGIARDAIQALLDTGKFLLGAVIWLVLYVLPVFLVIFIPLRLLWSLFRRWRRGRKQPVAAPPAAPANPASQA